MTTKRPMFPTPGTAPCLRPSAAARRRCSEPTSSTGSPKAESVHLVAGGAFAKGIQKWPGEPSTKKVLTVTRPKSKASKPWPRPTATSQCPPESAKSLERTMGALEFYFSGIRSATTG